MRKRNGKNLGFYYRCTSKICRKEFSVRKKSFFENSNLSIKKILRMMYFFVNDIQSQQNFLHEITIRSSKSIVDWKMFLRDVCCLHFLKNPVVLGGENIVVEIDECALVRRKYNRGRTVSTQ